MADSLAPTGGATVSGSVIDEAAGALDATEAEVVAEGAAKRLEPMSSSDRKIVHDVLADYEGVETRSEGDDPQRCVVIAPANA